MDYNIHALEGASTFVLVSLEQSKAIAMIDSKTLATRCERFVASNNFAYYIVLNTWGHQITQIASDEAWAYIWIRIQQVGLVPVIRDASALADMIIHGHAPEWDYTYGYLSILANTDYAVSSAGLASILRVLRYPKRFSPTDADIVAADSLSAFLAINTRCKGLNLEEPRWFWVKRLKERMEMIFKDFEWDITDGYFSSGTTTSTNKLLLPKLKAYANSEANLANCPLYQLSSAVYSPVRWRDSKRLRDAVKVLAVPKSYKAARIIAKEPPVSTFGLQAVAKGLLRAITRNGYSQYVDVNNQEYNQLLCEQASIDGKYATVDLSSASDSITEVFARSIVPEPIMVAIDEYRCAYLEAGKTRRIIQMFSTSGSPITFVMESAIFCAIAIEVGEFVRGCTNIRVRPPRIYGDDMVVDDRICETLCQVLDLLGFLPNMEKTFFGKTKLGTYRESCGVEYLDGMPMHTLYYPRNPVQCDAQGIASLCDLQHKFFDSWKLRLFLVDTVRRLEPRMTAHPFGCECDDVWDLIPVRKECAHDVSVDDPSRRVKHLGLFTKYEACNLNDYEFHLLSMWYYYTFLKCGPLYEDPLSELLRVSVSRCRYQADSSPSVPVWRWRVE